MADPTSIGATTPVQWIGRGLGPAAFALIALTPSGLHRLEGLGSRPAYAAAVAVLMAIWWFTEAVPIAWTACLPLLLYPLLGVYGGTIGQDVASAAQPYADPYIFLFLGGMTLGAAMEQWGLHRRLALHIMRAIGTAPKRLLLGMLVATAAVSLWISNTATAVMMMPIGMALVAQLEPPSGGRRLEHFGAALMLAVAYGANVGGIGTKIGTPTNSIFAGFVSEKLQLDLGFLTYLAIGLPFVGLFVPLMWLVLWRWGRRDAPARTRGKEVIEHELSSMGSMSRHERIVAWVFGAAALLWIAGDPLRQTLAPALTPALGFKPGAKHYEAAVALLAAGALIAAGSVSLATLRRIPWATLVLLGGSFAMASGIEGSGLSRYLGEALALLKEMPLVAQLGLAASATIGLSAVASNTATINVVLNVLPRSLPVLATTALAASCDFALPAGTPPNAVVFGSGYIRLPVMMRLGVLLDVAAAALLTTYGYLYLSWLLR